MDKVTRISGQAIQRCGLGADKAYGLAQTKTQKDEERHPLLELHGMPFTFS
ncbi:MAG TPA: hypothetical protein PKU68_05820 [Bacillota bacterium]|nr:hypothetical protein [Bacillota bacterium]